MVTALTVNYNTPDYLERLLTSFRKFYPDLPYLVVDGSNEENYKKIADFPQRFNITLDHFDYNIHHGPGMAYGIKKIRTYQILLVDSDMIILNSGWLEMMESQLNPASYGIGDIQKEYFMEKNVEKNITRIGGVRINKIKPKYIKIYCDYLHPVLALVNKNVVLDYPLPIKGGAPLIEAMTEIFYKKKNILQRAQWLTDDLWHHRQLYVQHNHNHEGMGTVVETKGYHLD